MASQQDAPPRPQGAPPSMPSPPAPEAAGAPTTTTPNLAAPDPPTKPAWPGTPAADCARMLDRALDRDPTVKFMVQRMAEVR